MDITRNDPTASPARSYFDSAAETAMGDPTTQLAVLMIEHAKDSRDLNRQQTRLEEDHLRRMQRDQVQFLRDQADDLRRTGRNKGIGMIVGGAATIAAGFSAADGDKCAAAGWEGIAGASRGVGEFTAAGAEKDAADNGASATEHDHKGGEAERRLQDLRDQRADLRDLEDAAFNHLENIQRQEAETNQTSASWRG